MKHYFLYFVLMPVTKKPFKKGKNKVASPEELKKLGERIRSLRIKNGYTNYENFAFENDIPRAQFGRYERGEDLRYSSLIKIIKAFRISVKEFFSEGFD
jgi:predicted transcriptional regulator